MEKIKIYSQDWFNGLENGVVLAARCKDCGAYEFPPVLICNSCGKHDMELVEISGEGELISINDACVAGVASECIVNSELSTPVLSGNVKLKEDPTFYAFIQGVPMEARNELCYKLPVKVKAEISARIGYKYVDFRVVE